MRERVKWIEYLMWSKVKENEKEIEKVRDGMGTRVNYIEKEVKVAINRRKVEIKAL